jgi:hypothetical protein
MAYFVALHSSKFLYMRVIPTRVHGILDYLVGALLAVAPWLFQFNRGGAETWVPVLLGAAAILYSLFTNYEWGVSRKIAMPTHLTLDLISGILLAVSPWLFGFADEVYLPHLIFGLLEIVVSLMTKRQPEGMKHITGQQTRAAV